MYGYLHQTNVRVPQILSAEKDGKDGTDMANTVSTSIKENTDFLDNALAVKDNFDVIGKTMIIGGKEARLYFIDGFIKDEIMQKIMEFFYKMDESSMPENAGEFMDSCLTYVETGLLTDFDEIITTVLSGASCLFVDGYGECISIDCRTYPGRSVEEPEKDKVMRGSRDGFVETLVFNTSLMRRRIRSPKLTMKMMNVGEKSKTDVVVCYMDDKVDKKFLKWLTDRIENIKVEALTMNQQSLAECLYHHKWYNPFPKFKFSERPDTAAASVMEGNVIILVDNSPSAMILPTSIFDIIEEADDYYFPPITSTYLRLSRFLITVVTLLLTPTFLLLMKNPQWIPDWLQFIKVKDAVNIPLIFQLLILELAIDGLRLAALNTPSILSTPLSVIAALVLGEFSVNSGWFNAEVMLYMAFVAIANYTQASFELGYALKFMRIITLLLTTWFGLWGYIGGLVITLVCIVTNRTISGKSYIYPLIPFNGEQLLRRFFRVKLKSGRKA